MEEEFWERNGIKTAFVWIAIDIIAAVFLCINGFNWESIKSSWLLLFFMIISIDRIVIPLANLPEPPKIFTFMVGIIPVGVLIAFYVALEKAQTETQIKVAAALAIALLIWNAANIGWGIIEKKKQNKKSGF